MRNGRHASSTMIAYGCGPRRRVGGAAHGVHAVKVIDELDDANDINLMAGGYIVDYHSCDFFPERFFQLVVVLRADNTILWRRLEARLGQDLASQVQRKEQCRRVTPDPWAWCRGYPLNKIQENVEAEIMQVVLEEARDSYKEELLQVCALGKHAGAAPADVAPLISRSSRAILPRRWKRTSQG
jgi:broad-specificity NMP kinase